ncbi:MAG: hypothetical protein WAU68_05170 [Vitreimonas sp.]
MRVGAGSGGALKGGSGGSFDTAKIYHGIHVVSALFGVASNVASGSQD